MKEGLHKEIQVAIRNGDYLFTIHAGRRMTERHISLREVVEALLSGGSEIIEDYPEDPRGPSCLVLGFTGSRQPIHVQCSYPPRIAIITAYEPGSEEWIDLRVRKGGRP